MPNVTAYATAKAGILGFTWSTANALRTVRDHHQLHGAERRDPDVGQHLRQRGQAQRAVRRDDAQRPRLRHLPRPANVAPFAVYLMSDAAR